eukprot:scaffold161203_cov51-Attheya_sp.AAC.3
MSARGEQDDRDHRHRHRGPTAAQAGGPPRPETIHTSSYVKCCSIKELVLMRHWLVRLFLRQDIERRRWHIIVRGQNASCILH